METNSTEVIELSEGSEDAKDSQLSQKPLEKQGAKRNNTDEKKTQDANGKFQEHSKNSRMELAVDTFEVKIEEKTSEK